MSTALFRMEHIQADDTGPIQTVHAYGHANERLEDIIRVQPHGFTSNPPVGSHGIGLALRGVRILAVALGMEHVDKRLRKLDPGNTAVYDAGGNSSQYLGSKGILHDAGSNPQKMTGKTIDHLATDQASIGASKGKTYIGGNGKDGTYAAVMTESGPSTVVFAKL